MTGRRASGTLASSLLIASALIAGPSASADGARADDPRPGDACAAADLGKRHPFVKNAVSEPTITHFKGYYVTDGSTGSQSVTLTTQTVVTVRVGREVKISSNFSIGALFKAEAHVGRTVTKETATTNIQSQTIVWNFLKPGYYGVYQGTRKVTGEYGSINCDRTEEDGRYSTRWVERPGGTFTTFATIEEGAVRCEDTVPAGSIMKKAQAHLGCEGTGPKPPTPPGPAPVKKAPAGRELPAGAVPPGFTCLPEFYRIRTPDRLLSWSNWRGGEILLWSGDGWPSAWRMCQGPESNGMIEHVILTGFKADDCLTLKEADTPNEGAALTQQGCRTTDDTQRFYLYRDVPGSDLVGIQNKLSGFMVGQERIVDDQAMRQYSIGRPDGTGTYLLEKIQGGHPGR